VEVALALGARQDGRIAFTGRVGDAVVLRGEFACAVPLGADDGLPSRVDRVPPAGG